MTWEPELRSWQTCSWLTLPQVVLLVPPTTWMLSCPSLESSACWVSPFNHTRAWGQSDPVEGSGVNSFTASPLEGALAWYGCTHIIARPNTLSPSLHPLVEVKRKVTSLLNLSALPQALRLVRVESLDCVTEATCKLPNERQMSWHP